MENRELKDQFMLRLPDGMRDAIRESAAREDRSMNAQIVQHLRAIYQPEKEVSA